MFEYIYKRRLLFSILFTIISFISIIISQTGKERTNFIAGNIIREVTNPIYYTLNYISDGLSNIWDEYVYLIDIRQENIQLKAKIEELTRKSFESQVIEKEYIETLTDMQFYKTYDIPKIYAEITLDIPRNYSKLIIINKGMKDGIEVNDGVITPTGAVGRVIGADTAHSSVMLINDIRSQYPVIIQRTGSKIMMSGSQEGKLKIYFVPRELDLRIGDVIMTSSHAGIFPRGIKVGQINNIKKQSFGLFQEGTVEPSVNFNKLERLFVIKSQGKKSINLLKLSSDSN